MATTWRSDDDTPYDEWLAQLEAKYGKAIARVIADAPPPTRKPAHFAVRASRRYSPVRGHAENPVAAPSAVDFRHHRSRIERGQ